MDTVTFLSSASLKTWVLNFSTPLLGSQSGSHNTLLQWELQKNGNSKRTQWPATGLPGFVKYPNSAGSPGYQLAYPNTRIGFSNYATEKIISPGKKGAHNHFLEAMKWLSGDLLVVSGSDLIWRSIGERLPYERQPSFFLLSCNGWEGPTPKPSVSHCYLQLIWCVGWSPLGKCQC